MPKPYPREFREDVIRVAGRRERGVHLKDIAADFGSREKSDPECRKPAPRDRLSPAVSMVAGGGFEPPTFGL